MKKLPILVLLVVLIFDCQHFVLGDGPEKSCRATVQDLTKLQLQLVAQCAKKMKFKNGKEKSKKQNCILRCAMVKAELTTPEGQVTPDSIDYLLHKYIPPSLIEHANKTFHPCMDIGIQEPFKTVEEDPFCTTYDPFVKCFLSKASTFCS